VHGGRGHAQIPDKTHHHGTRTVGEGRSQLMGARTGPQQELPSWGCILPRKRTHVWGGDGRTWVPNKMCHHEGAYDQEGYARVEGFIWPVG
jgi:hypothetical protein